MSDTTAVSVSPDVARAIEMMRACGITFARTSGDWLEDGYVAVKADPPFSTWAGVRYYPDGTYPPFIVGEKSAEPTGKRTLIHLFAALGKGVRIDAVPDQECITGLTWQWPELNNDTRGRRFTLADGRRFLVQERFYAGAVALQEPDRWEAVFRPIPKVSRREHGDYWKIPVLVGWRSGEMVALIMAIDDRDETGPVVGPTYPDALRVVACERAVCAREGCGLTFGVDPRRIPPKRFCSVRCAALHYGAARRRALPAASSPVPPPVVVCARDGCGRTFTQRRANKQFCSVACRNLAYFGPPKPRRAAWRETRTCAGCGQSFTAISSSRGQRYCQPGCWQRARRQAVGGAS